MLDNQSESPPARDRLTWIIIAPVIWAVHFLACYLTAAIWCAKRTNDNGLGPVEGWVIIYTGGALAGICLIGWLSFLKQRRGSTRLPHDAGTAADRSRFIGFAALLLSLLSFVATVFTGLAFVFIGSCD